MRKVLSDKSIARFQRLILDAGNLLHCAESTGISHPTVKRIISTGFAKEENIKKLSDYCKEVENVNV